MWMKFGIETNLLISIIGTNRDIPTNNKKLRTETYVIMFSLDLCSSFLETIIQEMIPKEILNVGNQKSSVLIVEIG